MDEITIETVTERTLLARKTTAAWSALAASAFPEMDRVWEVIRSNQLRHDHNIWIYSHPSRERVEMTVGVEILDAFEAPDGFVKATTPVGRAAHLVFMGDYSGLADAHARVADWITKAGHRGTGTTWEVYGDFHDDPAERRTDVFHALGDSPDGE